MAKLTLPYFVTKENKFWMGVIFGTVAAVLYLVTNHYQIFEPTYLTFFTIDDLVPFTPWTVWIYWSEFFLFISVYALSNDYRNASRYLYAFIFLQFISSVVFVLWPTTFPRHLYPLPADLDFLTYTLFNHIRTTDTPANCFPSLHVSSCYLSSFVFLNERRRLFLPFFLWASAVAISTMTTKQHYFVDVIAGLVFASVTYFLVFKWADYRELATSSKKKTSAPQLLGAQAKR